MSRPSRRTVPITVTTRNARRTNASRRPRDNGGRTAGAVTVFLTMGGKVTRGARPSTHHAPEHRRAVDSGHHAVGAPHTTGIHDAPGSRLARRGRGRHAIPVVVRDGGRASACPAPQALA